METFQNIGSSRLRPALPDPACREIRSGLRGMCQQPRCALAGPSVSLPDATASKVSIPATAPLVENRRRWRPTSAGTWDGDTKPFLGHSNPRVDAHASTAPIVILPGFGNCTSDYTAPSARPEISIVAHLQARGFKVEVLDIQRKDWLRVLRSLTTREYWTRSCNVAHYAWFLQQVKATMDQTRLKYGCDEVTLLAHSAGGWLARAFLADPQFFDACEAHAAGTQHNRAVRGIVTLGTPHVAAPPHTRDMTGGALTWVNSNWPDAFFAEEGVQYACIAGCSVRGNKRAPRRALARYSHSAYMQVCGAGHRVGGDSVVPARSAFLKGAENLLLDGVFHSPGKLGNAEEAAARPWYGSAEVVDAWAHHLL